MKYSAAAPDSGVSHRYFADINLPYLVHRELTIPFEVDSWTARFPFSVNPPLSFHGIYILY